MNAVAMPVFSDNTIGLLSSGTQAPPAPRLDYAAILFVPSRRTGACSSHEYTFARRRDADPAALKNCTMAEAVSGRSCQRKNQF
jgi:hypothetical protein